MARERQHSRATEQRKSAAPPPLDPAGDGWEGPNIRIDGLDIDAHIEREIERRLSQPATTTLKAWVREALRLDPMRSRERIKAYSRRLLPGATRAGFRTTAGSIETRIHEALGDERHEKNERHK